MHPASITTPNQTQDVLPLTAAGTGLSASSPLARAVSRKYLSNPRAAMCTGGYKGAEFVRQKGFYYWNGPHSWAGNMNNNGNMSHISWVSHGSVNGGFFPSTVKGWKFWGVRYGMTKYQAWHGMTYSLSDVGFMICPTLWDNPPQNTAPTFQEPHNRKMVFKVLGATSGGTGYGNGQDDRLPWYALTTIQRIPLARNVMWADGHATYMETDDRKKLPNP